VGLFGWLIGWLVCLLVGWLAGWLVGYVGNLLVCLLYNIKLKYLATKPVKGS
jgi:hypothetical protein